MSAAELIEEVKRLPRLERENLIDSILRLEDAAAPSHITSPSVQWPDTLERARKIFGNQVLPNLVLLERESNSY